MQRNTQVIVLFVVLTLFTAGMLWYSAGGKNEAPSSELNAIPAGSTEDRVVSPAPADARVQSEPRPQEQVPSLTSTQVEEPQDTPGHTPTVGPVGTQEFMRTPNPENQGRGQVSSHTLSGSDVSPSDCTWATTFWDDFSGDELDREKWNPEYKSGDKELQYYVDDALELKDGRLVIQAEEREVGDRKYASGIITTQGIFDQTYGLFEIRARIPSGQGLWPAFWLLAASLNYPPEIDVFEVLGHEPEKIYMTNHWRREDGKRVFLTQSFTGPNYSREFHTYAIKWSQEEIVWFIDGIERARNSEGVPDESMFLLINLAVGGEWPGYPDDSTEFPSYMEIDWVRAATWDCR